MPSWDSVVRPGRNWRFRWSPAESRNFPLWKRRSRCLNKFVAQDYIDSEVLVAQTDRERRATALADYLRDRGGKVSTYIGGGPGNRLDGGRRAQAGDVSRPTCLQVSQLSDKIALMKSPRVDWQTLKYAVASPRAGSESGSRVGAAVGNDPIGFGQSQAGSVRAVWRSDRHASLMRHKSTGLGWSCSALELEMGRLGLYPNYPEEQLIDKMQEATAQVDGRRRRSVHACRSRYLRGSTPRLCW